MLARLPALATELANLKCDVFFGAGPEANLAALTQSSRDMPIVFAPIVFAAVDFDPNRDRGCCEPRPAGQSALQALWHSSRSWRPNVLSC